jgi:hypothetical protein
MILLWRCAADRVFPALPRNPFHNGTMKKIASTTLLGLAAVVLTAADLSAQMCNGTAPFSAGKMRAGVGLSFPSDAMSIDGEFAVGSRSGLYGGVTASLISIDNVDGNGTSFGLNGGKAMVMGAKKNIEFCPQLLVGFGSLPGDISTLDIGGGVTFGTKMDASTSFDLIPFGGAFLVRNRVEVGTISGSETNLALSLGAGFVFSPKWTVRPYINIPITADNADATFGVMGSVNFGKAP